MQKFVNLHGKDIEITLSKAAETAAQNLTAPLVAEIHLILGCLVVKRVWFREQQNKDEKNITGNLNVCFRVVRYPKHCRISHIDDETNQPEDYPLVADKKAFVPRWLKIDYKAGQWSGEYGLV
ncbi:MAG: hypothetical protein OEY89_10625 [Gammaproteobacteria bacterium]|nr:hypothetical protein [Gammaproteobacteria bacterium]